MEKNHSFAALSRVFSYDPHTGIIRWKISPRLNIKAGSIAGHVCGVNGYRVIGYRSRKFPAHRIAWLLSNGKWPDQQIDHINMDRADNRLCNLREASASQNKFNTLAQRNNSSGLKGITWDSQKRRWTARIMVCGKRLIIGRFRDKRDAHSSYVEALDKHAGEFARV